MSLSTSLRLPFILLALLFLASTATPDTAAAADAADDERPNILWITTEDIGPHLGCYGYTAARTPVLDDLAARGVRFDAAWSTLPVCAAARTCMIMSMYPAATGGEHMRSMVDLPDDIRMFPVYLREAGYHCTNNGKEDFNHPKEHTVWDKGRYTNRADGQPFFAIVNHTGTHESKLRGRKDPPKTDPATVYVPSYMPDEPIVRREWANYIDNINTMDGWVGQQLPDLKKSGEADNTIVVFWGDHGAGMPRNKRYPGNSGLLVPFLVHVPAKFQALAPEGYAPGAVSKRMVGFVDLGATMLSLAGVKPPDHMHGRPFMGEFKTPDPAYNFGFRGRMDERPDLVRSIRDERYIYMRNYAPLRTGAQHVNYQHVTESTKLWKQQFDDGKLNDVQSAWWKLTPVEELYDLVADPDETQNLAADPAHADRLAAFRQAHREQTLRIKDTSFMPEQTAWNIGAETPLHTHAQTDYDIESIFDAAQAATTRDPAHEATCAANCTHENPTVRYWGAMGLHVLGADVVARHRDTLRALLADDNPDVRVAAAEGLAMLGNDEDQRLAIDALAGCADLTKSGGMNAMYAFNSLQLIATAHPDLQESIRAKNLGLLENNDRKAPRSGGYVARLQPDLIAMVGGEMPKKDSGKKPKRTPKPKRK